MAIDPLDQAFAELKKAILYAVKTKAKKHHGPRETPMPKTYRIVSRGGERFQ